MEKVLVIGGTNFIGRNLINQLLQLNQYEITVFNRGITNPSLFSHVDCIIGDRNTKDIDLLASKTWDFVIDLSCYFPSSISNILGKINQTTKRYIFISTCSVYDNNTNKTFLRNENAAILGCSNEECKDETNESYGKRKAECERLLQQSGLPYFILRPSLVYGKYDNTDRFYYWLYQVKKNNELLIPNNGEQYFSITFVDDLVKCIVSLLKRNGKSEVYNVTSTPNASIAKIVSSLSNILAKKPKQHFAKAVFLHSEQIKEWIDLPLWLNCDYFTYDNSKLLSDLGFETCNFETSLRKTIEYFDQLGWPEPKYGISESKKLELVNKL